MDSLGLLHEEDRDLPGACVVRQALGRVLLTLDATPSISLSRLSFSLSLPLTCSRLLCFSPSLAAHSLSFARSRALARSLSLARLLFSRSLARSLPRSLYLALTRALSPLFPCLSPTRNPTPQPQET